MIPFDRPLIAMQQYGPTGVPVPQMNLPPALLAKGGLAASTIINILVQTAQRSTTRMFVLNNLVYNNFQNNNYPRVVEMVLRQAAHLAISNNNPLNVEFFIPKAAEDICNLFISQIMVTNPQMMNMSNPNEINAFNMNYQNLAGVESHLMNLNLSVYMNASLHQGQQGGAPIYTNYTPQFDSGNGYAPQPQSGSNSIGSQWAAPSSQQPNQALQQAQNYNTQEYRVPQPQQAQTNAAPTEFLQSNNYQQNQTPQNTTNQQPVQNQPAPQQQFQPVVSNLNPLPLPLTCFEGTEMDINVHAIPYFGSNISVDLSSRRMDMKADALALSKASRTTTPTGPVLLNQSRQVEIGLEDALLEASNRLNLNRTDASAPTIYRFFAAVLNPRVCISGVEAVSNSIAASSHLGDAVTSIRKGYSNLFQDPQNPSLVEQNFLNSLTFLDRQLTNIVNHFLKYNLRTVYFIDSFSEDFVEICSIIKTKLGDVYADIFSSWCAKLHSNIVEFMTKHNDAAVNVVTTYLDEEADNLKFVYIPSFESVTFLALTSKELSYKVTSPTGHLIDEKNTPVLSDIVQTLAQNKKDRNMFTIKDWLVTADDRRYLLASSAVEPGAWYIYPHS